MHVRKTFIPKPYNWDSIDRIAILPIDHSSETVPASKSRRRSLLQRDFPNDSILFQLLDEMRLRIKAMDSSMVVFTVGKPTLELSGSALAKLAGNISGADAVLTMHVTSVDYNEATPEISGIYAMGALLPPIRSKPASTSARMTMIMKEVKYGEVIWQIDATGKATADETMGDSVEDSPPGLEVLLKDIIITAGSWLPFADEKP